MSDHIIRISDLSVDYVSRGSTVHAVSGFSLDIPENKITALVGESGCGKSTLAAALLHHGPGVRKGAIWYGEQNVLKLSGEALRKFRWTEISMVFQASQSALNPVMKIGDQFIETYKEHNGSASRQQILNKASELLTYVRLNPAMVLRAYPHQLSGGMKQRVMIALSLLLDPKVVILDEPTTALDVITQDAIFEILLKINRDFGTTMILVTHDFGIVAKVADYVAVMYAGQLMEYDNVYNIFKHPRHPYTKGLIEATPSLKSNNTQITEIEGTPPDLRNKPTGCVFHPRCPIAKDVCKTASPISLREEDRIVSCHVYNNAAYQEASVAHGMR
ncbi:MAG: ABC transporter ATP-binding protein [Alicyclobacillus sp.]|nr:ABC transporter ATP-binding protein [Alicyclobacillus sp.]